MSTVERPPPRAHHLRFKYALVNRALEAPRALVSLCGSPTELAALWEATGVGVDEAERCDGTGLAARNVGDPLHPVIMVTFPRPERPNEAYFVCVVPAAGRLGDDGSLIVEDAPGEPELRVFGLERSMLPDGGLIGFVVEWTTTRRYNYDAPDNGSPGALWKAILEIYGETRKPVHTASRTPGTEGQPQ